MVGIVLYPTTWKRSLERARSQNLLARVAQMIPRMRENAGKLDRETEFPVAEFDELRAIGARSAVVPERLVGWPFSGCIPSGLTKNLTAFQTCSDNVHSGQFDQRRVIEFYGKHVLPRVQEELKEA